MYLSLDYLFPAPSPAPSRLAPCHPPVVSPTANETLRNILKDNHIKWHVFVNELRFHNHAPDRAIALWALGVDADMIRERYEKDCTYLKPRLESPGPITEENFNEHLGDDRYFDAYIQFFAIYVNQNGFASTLEEFLFSPRANTGMNPELPVGQQPQMLNRSLSGVLHPFIHVGSGAEFSLPGLLVHGLAETAVHHTPCGFLEPLFLFTEDTMSNRSAMPSAKEDPHVLTILARVLRDTKLDPLEDTNGNIIYISTMKKYGKEIAAYVNAWNIDPRIVANGGWEKKLEEIVWMVVVLYGVAGWTHGRNKETGFTADFFFLHLVTSSIFLPSVCALISPISCARLLKAYVTATCVWAVARGRPLLDVKGFAADVQQFVEGMPSGNRNEDLWAKLTDVAKVHPEEHVAKAIRSLSSWAKVFGSRRARVPLIKKTTSVTPSLAIDATVANKQLKNAGDGEDDIVVQDADLSPRSWRDWKNGALMSPTRRVRSSRGESRRASNDPDLSPRSWRELVNGGCISEQPFELDSLPQTGLEATATVSANEEEYMPSTELPGSEYLDGGLFLRVAILTFKRIGWDLKKGNVLEPRPKTQETEIWDFEIFH